MKRNRKRLEFSIVSASWADQHKIPRPSTLLADGWFDHVSFGKAEVEWAAHRLVEFFAKTGDVWREFNLTELDAFCQREHGETAGSALFGLICPWYDDGGFGVIRSAGTKPYSYIVQIDECDFSITTILLERLLKKDGK